MKAGTPPGHAPAHRAACASGTQLITDIQRNGNEGIGKPEPTGADDLGCTWCQQVPGDRPGVGAAERPHGLQADQ